MGRRVKLVSTRRPIKKAGAAFAARLGSFGSSSNHAQVRAGQGPPRNPSGATK
jgi:hypothetical protein